MAPVHGAGRPLSASLSRHLQTLDGKIADFLAGVLGKSVQESSELQQLRHRYCNEPFDPTSGETHQMLLDIWNAAFPMESITSADAGKHWKRLGFQSSRPCSDIRAGRFALAQLHYLAIKRPQLLQRLATEAEVLDYPFACSCFNVSHVIALFFDLYTAPAMSPVGSMQKASYIQMRNFVQLCKASTEGSQIVLNELFCILIEQLHSTWKHRQATGEVNMMDFPIALRDVHNQNATFWRTYQTSTANLDASWLNFCNSREENSQRSMIQCDTLHLLNMTLLAAFRTIVKAFVNGAAVSDVVECGAKEVHTGSYQPPTIPESPPEESMTKRWLAKPANDIDVDSLLESLCSCKAEECEGLEYEAGGECSDLDLFLDLCLSDTHQTGQKVQAI